MKNLLFISLIAILFSACSSDELTQKKAELADLKKQEA